MHTLDDNSRDPFAHGGNLAEVRERYALDGRPLLDFSANINPLGMPDSVRTAILQGLSSLVHYPDTECRRLRRKLADRLGVKPGNIIVGNGSTELMFLATRAFLRGLACVIDPTFTEYRHAVEHAGAKSVSLVVDACCGFRIGADTLGQAAKCGQMVFLCNPNNPTGAVTSKTEILSAASRFCDALLVIDEAFCDFLAAEEETSVAKDAAGLPNVIVLRSLTKFYAIPGLRLGYLVAREDNVERMLRLKEPWSVNSLAEAAGCAALDDVEFATRSKTCVGAWKMQMADQIADIRGLAPLRPSVNFILVHIVHEGLNADVIQRRLLKDGILVRNCANFPGLDHRFFRVAVRTPQENAVLVDALRGAVEATA